MLRPLAGHAPARRGGGSPVRRRRATLAVTAIAAVVTISTLGACTTGQPLTPEEPGGGGPAQLDTIFHTGFEDGSLANWDDGYDPSRHRIVTDAAFAREGSRFLEVTYPAGSDGGFLNEFFMPGYDSVYVRLHVRLADGWEGGTKIVALYGSRIDEQWSAFGKAGICPSGTDFFNSMIVTEPAGGDPPPLRFYTYYHEMSSGGGCWGSYGDGSETYVEPLILTPGAWHRIEFWFRINQPGDHASVQRFWVDGVLRGEWSGFSVRTSDVLRINALQLTFSVCCGGAPKTQLSYVDDVLVATATPSP
jgi:hypothetical protein